MPFTVPDLQPERQADLASFLTEFSKHASPTMTFITKNMQFQPARFTPPAHTPYAYGLDDLPLLESARKLVSCDAHIT